MSVPISLRTELARERAVDLDLVGREAAERGIAGAEIVHRDADAELAGLLPEFRKALESLRKSYRPQQPPNRADWATRPSGEFLWAIIQMK